MEGEIVDITELQKLIKKLVDTVVELNDLAQKDGYKDLDVIADATAHIRNVLGDGEITNLLVQILGEISSTGKAPKPKDISGYVKSITGNAGNLVKLDNLILIREDLEKVRKILEHDGVGGGGGRGTTPGERERRRKERERRKREKEREADAAERRALDAEFDPLSRWRINDVNGKVKGKNRALNKGLMIAEIGLFFLKGIFNIAKDFGKNWMKFNDDAFRTMRQLGMSRQDIQSIQKSNIKDTMRMGLAYGLSVEDINKFQASVNRISGRNNVLSADAMESMAAGRVLLGEEVQNELIASFDKMGGSVDVAMSHAALSFERAKAMGLNAVQLSSNVAKNMHMASRYAFKNGVDGMAKMTALSQRLKFNLESIGGALDKASNIEGAIDMSAQMQLLGGKYAAAFGNPIELLNAGLNDAEDMVKKMVEITKGNAVFDRESGTVKINNVDRQMMKHAAQATGMNYDDLLNMTNSQATLEAARQDIAKANLGLTDDQREKLATMAQYDMEKKAFTVTYASDEEGSVNGKVTKLLSEVRAEDIDRIQADTLPKSIDDNVRDIHAILKKHFREYAKSTTSLEEQVKGLKSQISATKANTVNGMMNGLHNGMAGGLGAFLAEHPYLTLGGSMLLGGIGGGLIRGAGRGLWRGFRKWRTTGTYGPGGATPIGGRGTYPTPTPGGTGPGGAPPIRFSGSNPLNPTGSAPVNNLGQNVLGRNNTSFFTNAKGETYAKVRQPGGGYKTFNVRTGQQISGAAEKSLLKGKGVTRAAFKNTSTYNSTLKGFAASKGVKASTKASIKLGGKVGAKAAGKGFAKLGGKFVPGLGIAMGAASMYGGVKDVQRRKADGDTAGAWIDGVGKIGGGAMQAAGSALMATGFLAPVGAVLTGLGTAMEFISDFWNAKRDEARNNKIHAEAQTRYMETNRLAAQNQLKGLENEELPEVNGDVAVNGKIVIEFPNKQEFESQLINDPNFQRRLVAVIEDRQHRAVSMGTTRDRSAAEAVMKS